MFDKKIIHTVFENAAEKFPENIAAEQQDGQSITYTALNEKANRIAHALREKGVKSGTVVGVAISSSIEYVACLLGVFKSGGIFMPIDTDTPKKRLKHILEKTSPAIIATNGDSALSDAGLPILETGSALDRYPNDNPPLASDPDDGNYIMFTSGSTGEPKAILGRHKTLSHFIHWETREFGLDETTKTSQLSPETNDVVFRDIFAPLIVGGTVCIPDPSTAMNTNRLSEWLDESGVTLIHTVPSLFRLILKQAEATGINGLSSVKQILLVGEELYGTDVIRWTDLFGDRIELVNLYGASETLAKAFHRIKERPAEPARTVPVGLPISNTAILVIKDGALCGIREIGEIHIKSPFVGKGYYNDPELTAKSFIPNPLTGDTGDIVYKTGDLGRYLPDRSVEFIGRTDRQVKINALRVELSEVEGALLTHEGVDQCHVAVSRTADLENRLTCYHIENRPIETGELRAWLKQSLPDHMVPSYFVRLDEFPLTISGKIDRRALPKPEDLIYGQTGYVAPESETEQKLADIWSEVLGLKKTGVESPYFEIGGNSLNAIRIISRIYRAFEIEISIKDFLDNSTIRKLAGLIERSGKSDLAEIEPLPEKEHYGLSHAQRRLWILDRLEQHGSAYNITSAFFLEGELDGVILEKAFRTIVDRHESLRTTFVSVDGEPMQKIHADIGFALETADLRGKADEQAAAAEYAAADAAFMFDLSKGPLIRARLLTITGGHILAITMNHIISDALSGDILAKELAALYDAFSKGKENPLPPLRFHYKDFAAWQNGLVLSGALKEQSDYWQGKLGGGLPVLDLPTDRPRPPLQTYNGDRIRFDLDRDTLRELDKIRTTRDSTLFMMLISLVKVLLHRYTAQNDIIVGSPITGRSRSEFEDQIGFFVNMLALRDEIGDQDAFSAVLEKVKNTCLEAYANNLYPFDRLVDDLDLERDLSRAVVFDVMVVLNAREDVQKEFPGLGISNFHFDNLTSIFDLTFTFSEYEDRLELELEYNTDLFDRWRIENMKSHFRELVKSVIRNPEQAVCRMNILPESERDLLIRKFNDTAREYPADKTISELVEKQAEKLPDHPALAYEDSVLTYRELNTYANRLAHTLKTEMKVGPEECVAVLTDKSEWMIVSMLGILKAGGAYVPIDPTYPSDRVGYMIEDAGCRVVLSDRKHIAGTLSGIRGIEIVEAVSDNPVFAADPTRPERDLNPEALGNGDSLAYVIYTSGSTGKPKGTLIEHHSVSRLVLHPDHMSFDVSDRVAQTCAATFDVSVFEIWGALINGCLLCIPPEGAILEATRMDRYIKKHKIQTMWLTTSLFNQLVEADTGIFEGLEVLIVGGEKLSAYHINKVKKAWPKLMVMNGYGPTENTIFTTFHHIEEFYENEIPIGRPVANSRCLILDRNNEIVPVGVPGELCSGGGGVGRGYLNRPGLTAEKFVGNPLEPGSRMYRIGDVCRWRPDGTIEFFGRNDDQVKIRGFRIELGEIENTMLDHPDIGQAVVMVRTREDGFNKELAAYFVSSGELGVTDLRNFLGRSLPGYMIPTHFVAMKNLPLNASGKVDRKALPSPEKAALGSTAEWAKPRNETERLLLDVWQSVLLRENIGIHDNYFEVGGDSIKAIQIASRLQQEGVKIEVREIFQYPTVEELAENAAKFEQSADQGMVTGEVPLTAVQSWFFDNLRTKRGHFNQSEMLFSEQRLDESALRTVFAKIMEHHDMLRTRFVVNGESVVQEICDSDYPLGFETADLRGDIDAESRLAEHAERVQAGTELDSGPMMRVVLFKTDGGDRLLMVIHHLVVDGISWRVLAEDIRTAYTQCLAGEPVVLPPKTHSFKDWAEKIAAYGDSPELLEEKAYWKQIEASDVKPLPDEFGTAEDSRAGDTRESSFELSEADTDGLLTKVHHAYNTEINDILLTAFARAMKNLHGENRTLITLEGHGREPVIPDTDIGRTVGWFTSMFPVILELSPNGDIGYQIKRVKETLRNIPNKGMGYGILKYVTSPENRADMTFNHRPRICFNYLGQFDGNAGDAFRTGGYSGRDVSPEAEIVHDLDVNGLIDDGKLRVSVAYNSRLFEPETADRLAEDFRAELSGVIEHCANREDTELTPGDIDYDGLDIDGLDDVLKNLS